MVGKYSLKISNKYVCYNFTIKRKITILRGMGASGKSYMAYLSTEHLKVSNIVCDVKVINLGYSIESWQEVLKTRHNCIIIVDEDFPYIKSVEFGKAVLNSDNYFVLISRHKFANLPYSISEIYYLVSDYKADNTTYSTFANQYLDNVKVDDVGLVITEDTRSGYQFFSSCLDIDCKPADGKADIKNKLIDYMLEYDTICAIVDGAAFGSDIEELLEYSKVCKCNFYLLAPESFEYLLLNVGVFNCSDKYLRETYNYHDISTLRDIVNSTRLSEIVSWEDFYTELLSCLSRNKGANIQYSKSSLKPFYLGYKDKVLQNIGLL